MDEMTGPGEDPQKHKSDDAAKYLAESFFGLNLNPADVGGEVLFDDYDDAPSAVHAGRNEGLSSVDRDESVQAFVSADASGGSVTSMPNRFEENLDDLIVFSDDDDDDEDQIDDEEDDEDDDENFDFGDEDDDDEDDDELDDDELDEDEDFDEEEDEDEDELDDAELDFGDDVMDPAPKKAVPVAQDSRGTRDARRDDSRASTARSDRSTPDSRDQPRPSAGHRGDRSDERTSGRGVRPHESTAARSDSRGSDRPPAANAAESGRKSPPADDEYWNELDGWVWEDESKTKPAAASASRPSVVDDDDEDEDEEISAPAPVAKAGDEDEAPKPRRGRRRGGRGRGRGRREGKETASEIRTSDSPRGTVDLDDDFSEIMFEEDQEDFVSVSAGSAKAQRRMKDDPESQGTRKLEPDDADDVEDTGDDVERSEASEARSSGARRGRRGRRGRGREESREPAGPDKRSPARPARPARDEDNMDDDLAEEDVELADFGDQDDEGELPRRRQGSRSESTPRGQGRGRGERDREPRVAESSDPPRRQPAREPRSPATGDETASRRGPRPPRVAAEFQDIPTWEEAIGSLAIRTPSEEHARRAESRGRRDGGRPPRRRS